MVAEPAQRLFTIEEYECMINAGIVRSGERVELLEGTILTMAAMAAPHRICVVRLDRTLKRHLPATVDVYVQLPVRIPPDSEPEPDIAIVWHRDDDYASGHPGPDDILLLIEVSDTTLRDDRDRKLPLYAAAGIRESWLADLGSQRIWIYRAPRGGQYTGVTSVGRGDTISSLAFPNIVLAVDDLLPPALA